MKKTKIIILIILLIPVTAYKYYSSGWDQRFGQLYSQETLEKFNNFYAKELKNTFSVSVDTIGMEIPKAYTILAPKHKDKGSVNLSSELPDLQPWRLTNEKLEAIQQLNTKNHEEYSQREGPLLYTLLGLDQNYVGIRITSAMVLDDMIKQETYPKKIELKSLPSLLSEHGFGNEQDLGLNIYNKYLKYPRKGKTIIITASFAAPNNTTDYPNVKLACADSCMIFSTYKDKMGLVITFHPSQLNQWSEIWKNVIEKLDTWIV